MFSVRFFHSLTPEEINWHLLQLCLLRDYIDLEFHSLKVNYFDLLFDSKKYFSYFK